MGLASVGMFVVGCAKPVPDVSTIDTTCSSTSSRTVANSPPSAVSTYTESSSFTARTDQPAVVRLGAGPSRAPESERLPYPRVRSRRGRAPDGESRTRSNPVMSFRTMRHVRRGGPLPEGQGLRPALVVTRSSPCPKPSGEQISLPTSCDHMRAVHLA